MIKEAKIDYNKNIIYCEGEGGVIHEEITAIFPNITVETRIDRKDKTLWVDIMSLVPFNYERDTYLVTIRTQENVGPGLSVDDVRLLMDSFEREVKRVKEKAVPDINFYIK